jgi:hypothetical protein
MRTGDRLLPGTRAGTARSRKVCSRGVRRPARPAVHPARSGPPWRQGKHPILPGHGRAALWTWWRASRIAARIARVFLGQYGRRVEPRAHCHATYLALGPAAGVTGCAPWPSQYSPGARAFTRIEIRSRHYDSPQSCDGASEVTNQRLSARQAPGRSLLAQTQRVTAGAGTQASHPARAPSFRSRNGLF